MRDSNDYGKMANNFKKLDIRIGVLPLNNMMELKNPKVYSEVLCVEKGFLFIGDSFKSTVVEWVLN